MTRRIVTVEELSKTAPNEPAQSASVGLDPIRVAREAERRKLYGTLSATPRTHAKTPRRDGHQGGES